MSRAVRVDDATPAQAWSTQPVGAGSVMVVLLFLLSGSLAMMVACRACMPAMAAVPMPGGWTMSALWVPMCGQTWSGAALSFLGMWMPMMVAMMLPSLAPVLWRCRRMPAALTTWVCTACLGTGYFVVWGLLGALVFPLGAAIAATVMRLPALAQAVPSVTAAIVTLAGVFQCSGWKQRVLACCRRPCRESPLAAGSAWRDGVRLGLRCSRCCTGLTAVLLVCGVMDLGVMVAVTIFITAERLAPEGGRIARVGGAFMIGAGVLMMAAAMSSA